jgi:hypothetical protein
MGPSSKSSTLGAHCEARRRRRPVSHRGPTMIGATENTKDRNSWRPKLNGVLSEPQPIVIDPHYSPQFYAELCGTSPSTVVRWFQDADGVLKLSTPSKNGKRTRVELRIPHSLAMREYRRRTTSR